MQGRKLAHLLWASSTLLLAAPALASSVRMAIKPAVCALAADEDYCAANIEISWSSPNAIDTCLFLRGTAEPVTCWTNADAGAYDYEYKGDNSIHLSLRSRHNGKTQAHAVFQVIQENVEYRYRRRRPWHFF